MTIFQFLILSHFPSDVNCLIEPFCGASAIALSASAYGLIKKAVINDLNEPLMRLWDDVNEYMLLSASANRAKSWSCENCPNWKSKKLKSCKTCYWAYPESYSHIAMRDIRRLDLLWAEEEIVEYETLLFFK